MTDQFEDVLESLRDVLADKYEMQSLLGAGGMGAVYLARDVKHDRQVAIKVLHPEFAQSLGAERFLREVSVTAKLSHPHILPLYDSGDADGFLYYVMPLVEGEDLSERIKRDKQLPIKDAVMIAKEVAEALGYAHSMGLVHRDIKPGNIMLSGGHAIVVDFGIARAVDAAGGEKITQTGMSVGTPAYMSPEQSLGEDVDGRADLYSLGCVLYETLVGQIPFTGPTPMAIMARHTMDNIPPPTIMREAVPDELEDVIMRAMAKTPADRYQTGMEMVEALDMVDVQTAMHRRPSVEMRRSGMMRQSVVGRQSAMFDVHQPWWKRMAVPVLGGIGVVGLAVGAWSVWGSNGGGGRLSSGLDPQRIAVLYFDDLSSDGSLSGVADGLAEELIDELQRANLDVTSSNGVRPYRGSSVARDSIARALGVGTLIVGTVERRPGDSVLITTRIVDGGTLENIGDPDRSTISADQITAARDSVVADVSLSLRARIGRDVSLRASRGGTDNAGAYAAYRRAVRNRQEAQVMLATGEDGIVPLLIAADSLLALAQAGDDQWVDPIVERGWVALARSELTGGGAAVEAVRMGLPHAERALALDRRAAAAFHLRGSLRWQLYLLRAAETEEEWNQLLFSARQDLDSAIALDPSLAEAYATLSFVLYQPQIDDVNGALGAAETGYQRDQFVANANVLIHRTFWGNLDLGNFNQADRWCARGSQQYPDAAAFKLCQLWLMVTPREEVVDTARARQLVAAVDSIVPDIPAGVYASTEAHIALGGVLGKAGDTTAARVVLEEMDEQASFDIDPDQELGGRIAYMYTLFDLDRAVDYVKAYVVANPHHHFVEAAGTVWWWRELRNHPRWSEIAALGGG